MKNKKLTLIPFLLLTLPGMIACGGNTPTPGGDQGGDVGGDSQGDSQGGEQGGQQGGEQGGQQGGSQTGPQLSGQKTKHLFTEKASLIDVRYPGNSGSSIGNEAVGFGMKWTEDNWDFQEDIEDSYSSYARIVVNAPQAGEYPVKLHAKGFNQTYPFRVYVNSKAATARQAVTISDSSYVWGTDEKDSSEFKVNLNQGKNIILVQVIKWGTATAFTLPNELTVIKNKGTETANGIYTQDDMLWQVAYPAQGIDILDPNTNITYGALKHDTDVSFEGAAILNFTPKATTKSLDVTYKVASFNGSDAAIGVRCMDGANQISVDVSEAIPGREAVAHIPSYELADAGFQGGSLAKLHLGSANGEIQILKVSESTQVDVDNSVTIGVNEIKSKALIRGRNIPANNTIGIDWTAAGIEFDITGGGNVYADLREVTDHFGSRGTASGGTRFAVEIDGVFSKYVVPSTKTVLATGLSAAKHNIAIYKTSEACGGLVDLHSLKVSQGASISKPAAKAYKFEVYGDSITCGNQVTATEENGYEAYETKLAKSWNADLSVISCSGRGLKLGYNAELGWPAKWDNQINSMSKQTSYFRDGGTATWNASEYEPDVIIANLGNNDLGDYIMSIAPMTISEFTTEVVRWANELRGLHANAKILFVYGAFVNRKFESEYRTAVQGIGDVNIDFLYLNQYGGGSDGHPSAEQHTQIANDISNKLASMMNVSDPRAK